MTCSVCKDEYYFDEICTKCSVSLLNCLTCSDVSTCITCEVDYQPLEGKCVMKCNVENCLSCANDP